MSFDEVFAGYAAEVNTGLEKYLPKKKDDILASALRYSVFAGGKRIRPVICLAFCEMLAGSHEKALTFACALEMTHTHWLIYDDLPCMDNDSLRRGRPTNHIVFGESTAVLAASGLFSEALRIIVENGKEYGLNEYQLLAGIKTLIGASGVNGVTRGQLYDLENKPVLTEKELFCIHELKTASLLKAAAILGCIAAEADKKVLGDAESYAENLGLAFQIKDDILDVVGSADELGKTVGKDSEANKTTFVTIYGLQKAQDLVNEYTRKAVSCVGGYKNSEFLSELAVHLASRTK